MKRLLFVLLLGVSISSFAQKDQYFNTSGVAIRGYDPVAYFNENTATEGSKDFVYKWNDVEWRFKNAENLNTFKAAPAKYAPQFGGYCAYGVSENHKSPTEPNAFTIVDDKLYLNYNLKVKELWTKDTKGNIVKGDKNWTGLKDKE